MKNYKAIFLNALLDKYERSKTFSDTNRVNQKFSLKPEKLEPAYTDDAEYEIYKEINAAVKELENRKLITVIRKRNDSVRELYLNIEQLETAYTVVNREPKREIQERLRELLESYTGYTPILDAFIEKQMEQIKNNRKVAHFDDYDSFEWLLKGLAHIEENETEIFVRDYSMKVYGDSKIFELVRPKVLSVLDEYGDFPERETILEEHNIIRNPGHVYFKGEAVITVGNQMIDISALAGDIAFSSGTLNQISKIDVHAPNVITIENLTTFNMFNSPDVFAIYLGGYHNHDRRLFIQRLYEQNPLLSYYHYGDIDAGGFHILLHLREKTGVRFRPYCMDVETLRRYERFTKTLTENDRRRLRKLLDTEFAETVKYMLEHNCKLEQEALDLENTAQR